MNKEDSSKQWISVDEVKFHPMNPQEHPDEQLEKIAESIKGNGSGKDICLSSDHYILAGEGTFRAMTEKLGWKEIPFTYLEPRRTYREPEALAYMIADNKAGTQSKYELW